MRKNIVKKSLGYLMCGSLLIGTLAGCTEKPAATEEPAVESAAEDTKNDEADTEAASGNFDDEMIYVLTGTDGAVRKVMVSGNNGQIETSESDGNLPVAIHVSYELDGNEISAEELPGKSGHLVIRYEYENLQKETVDIDGKKVELYVPYAAVTGMMLDDAVFSNVEITNGKIVDDGNHSIAVGYALPGLQENLNIDKDKLEIPDYMEISADVTDFELANTATMITDEIFRQADTEKAEGDDEFSIDSLKEDLDKLTDGMDQLLNGSSKLYDGLATLYEKSGELSDGVDQLADGTAQLSEGTVTLQSGAGELQSGMGTLQSGAGQLLNGLNTLVSNNETLNGGAGQVYTTLLSTATTQLRAAGLEVPDLTIANYTSVLNAQIAALDQDKVYQTALSQVTALVEQNNAAIEAGVTEAVQAQVTAQVNAAKDTQIKPAVTAQVNAVKDTQIKPAVTEQVEAARETLIKPAVAEQVNAVKETQIKPLVEKQFEAQVHAGVLEDMGLTEEEYQAMDDTAKAQVDAGVAAQMATDENQAKLNAAYEKAVADTIEQKTDEAVAAKIKDETEKKAAEIIEQKTEEVVQSTIAEKMASDEVKAIIAQNIESTKQQKIAEGMQSAEVQEKLGAAAEGVQTLAGLKTSLDSYNVFYTGLAAYTAGVSEAANGANTLKDGADKLKAGTDKLKAGTDDLVIGAAKIDDGVNTIKDKMPDLLDGVQKLRDGSKDLQDGLQEFNDEGIQKLVDAVNGDLKDVYDRLKATMDLAKSHNTSGTDDDTAVNYIYRVDSIEKED